MLSRVAETLYWLSRHLERAENTARIVLVNANLDLDLPRGVSPGWQPLVDIVGGTAEYDTRRKHYDERGVVSFLVSDSQYSGSIVSSVQAARANARTVREMIPRELWEHVNDLHLYAREHLRGGLARNRRHEHLQHVIQSVQTFTGMLEGTMSVGVGHRFLEMGRYLERADMTSRIVDVRSQSLLHEDVTEGLRPFENIQWMNVLKSLTGYQMYRLKKRVRVHQEAVLEFLLLDDEFPRSVLYCVQRVEEGLSLLPVNGAPLKAVARARAHLRERRVQKVTADSLHDYLTTLQRGLAGVHAALVTTYFDPEQAA